MEATSKVRTGNTTSPFMGMMGQMGTVLDGLGGSNTSASLAPLQALQLGQNIQIGVSNIVGGDWNQPRTVTTQTVDLAALFGLGINNPSPEARAHFIMVFVVPYVGKTNLGSIPLKQSNSMIIDYKKA